MALTALGEANSTRAAASRVITPSPTRGASLESGSSTGNGKVPAATIRARRSKTAT